jgi:oligopeptide/dipeptide ABC transporter ATP-binding protein
VSFSLEKGKMHALVGESGCGKTISAMSILQLLPKTAKITSGEIIFDGENLLKMKNLREIRGSKIALIPQDPMTSLNPLYTIGNQLLEVIKIHHNLKGNEAYKTAIEALDAVQIPCAKERMNAYPHEFSGGMKQRAIIAMALACDAQILIADEPTTALDVTIQAQIMNLLDEIKRNKQTSILLITHDLALVGENSDYVSVMYAGRIVESAPSNEFFKNPRHPYTKALLRSLPSNSADKLETIQGQPPTIMQDISGCRFNPRCKECQKVCIEKVPTLDAVGQNHFCACFKN